MDYKAIKEEYQTTKTSFKKLATKYNIHYKQIEREAKKEGWIKYHPKATITAPIEQPTISKDIKIDTQTPTNDIKELLKGYYSPVDNIMLELLMDTYVSYQELKREVSNEGRILKSQKGGTYYNPKYSALQMEKMNLIKIQKELGITVAQRIKLKLDLESDEKQQSIFDFSKFIMEDIDV